MALIWSQKVDTIEMFLIPYLPILENFSNLAGLEVKLGQTLFQHGPNMVPKSRHSIEMLLRPYSPSLENFRALVGLEVKLGQKWSQKGLNMALTWFQTADTP